MKTQQTNFIKIHRVTNATIRKLGLEPDSTCVVLVVSVFAQRKKISVNKQIRINLIDINGKEINKYHTKTIIK